MRLFFESAQEMNFAFAWLENNYLSVVYCLWRQVEVRLMIELVYTKH